MSEFGLSDAPAPKLNAGMFSSARGDWRTPEVVLDLVRQVGPIRLDPCTSADNPVGAERFYTPKEDGLVQPWDIDSGLVYVNPPFGRGIGAWIDKCVHEHAKRDVSILALVPSRTDTRWWWRAVSECHGGCYEVAFWPGRMTFVGAPGPAPFPSALLWWGGEGFADIFRDHGCWVVTT